MADARQGQRSDDAYVVDVGGSGSCACCRAFFCLETDEIIASNTMSRRFTARKRELVTKLAEFIDRSPKGSVDEPICELISYINQQDDYVRPSHAQGHTALVCQCVSVCPLADCRTLRLSQVTTSSCSGRVSIFAGNDGPGTGSKGSGRWALVCHRIVTAAEVSATIAELTKAPSDELVRACEWPM